MRVLTALLITFVLSTSAWAQGTFSVPFTARQQVGAEWKLVQVNAERAGQAPPLPALTLQAFGRQACQAVLTDFVLQRAHEREQLQSVRGRYLLLDDVGQAEVEALIDSLLP